MPLSGLPKTSNFEGSKVFFRIFLQYRRIMLVHYRILAIMITMRCVHVPEICFCNGIWYKQRVTTYSTKSDVNILRKSCIYFTKNSVIHGNEVDLFFEASTFAGAWNLVFRRIFLVEKSIGIITPGGYRLAGKQSKLGLNWLMWRAHPNNIHIIHAGVDEEYRLIQNIKVDGYHENSKTVYEFIGCYYHSCERCFPHQNRTLSIPCYREVNILQLE